MVPSHNRLGLRFVLDTNVVDDESEAMVELRSLHDDGWIALVRTDLLQMELDKADAVLRQDLSRAAVGLVQLLGPQVAGRPGNEGSFMPTEQDGELLERVRSTLAPTRDWTRARENDWRDAMHIRTAIRYGTNGFVTLDRRLLKRAAAVKEAFNGFVIMSPTQALAFARRMRTRHETRASSSP